MLVLLELNKFLTNNQFRAADHLATHMASDLTEDDMEMLTRLPDKIIKFNKLLLNKKELQQPDVGEGTRLHEALLFLIKHIHEFGTYLISMSKLSVLSTRTIELLLGFNYLRYVHRDYNLIDRRLEINIDLLLKNHVFKYYLQEPTVMPKIYKPKRSIYYGIPN